MQSRKTSQGRRHPNQILKNVGILLGRQSGSGSSRQRGQHGQILAVFHKAQDVPEDFEALALGSSLQDTAGTE